MQCLRLSAPSAWLAVMLLAWVAPASAQLPEPTEVRPTLVIPMEENAEVGSAPVVTGVALNRNASLIAISGDDHLAQIFDIAQGKFIAELRGHTDWVRAVAFHPIENTVATAGDDGVIRLWNGETGELIAAVETDAEAIYQLAFSPDGELLAHSGFDNQLRIHDGNTGEALYQLECASNDVRALAFSPDHRQVAAAGRTGTVRLWSLADRSLVRDITASRRRVHSIAFSANSSQIATAAEDRELRIWNVADGTLSVSLPRQPGIASALVYCGPDHLAAGYTNNRLRLWHVPSRQAVQELVGHTGSVVTLDFNPDMGTLVSGSFDTTVCVWSLPGISGPAAKLPADLGGVLLR